MKKNNLFKKFCILTLLSCMTVGVFAQMAADPAHSFYKDVQNWERLGVVSNLPPIRPYPVRIIRNLLQTVIENGTETQAAKAQEYYEELTGRPFHAQLELGVNYRNQGGEDSFSCVMFPQANGDALLLNDLIGISYKLGFAGYITNDVKDYISQYLPAGTALQHDTLQDPGMIGPFSFYLDTDDTLSFGNDNYYCQIGLNRLGYGRFLNEGLSLNDSAYHSANIIFTVLHDRWNYTQLYSAIGASKLYDGSGLLSNKYMAFHQFEFKFTPKISLTYYENMVYGKRFDFSYLIPAPYMAIQGLGGCNDNLQMGLMFNFEPFNGFLWSTDVFVDDVNFNDLIKFNFNTKLRIAAETGVIYTPVNSIFSNLALRYTLVTPYTYTHWDYSDDANRTMDKNTFNYQNYANNGLPIGSTLPPNSDQIKFSFDMNPIKALNLSFNFAFSRHGNSAETLPTDEALFYLMAPEGVYATNGSINHHVMIDRNPDDGYLESAKYSLNFLNQQHIMYTFQGGFDAEYTIGKWKFGQFIAKAGYTAEYIINKGVDANMFPGGKVTASGGTYTYNGTTYGSADEVVQAAKIDWANSLKNTFNNYLYLGLQWRW